MTFSIVIPVYNVAPYLRECLESLLEQTCKDWEAICVDDGSTDGSALILDEYQSKDNRIRVVHQENSGVSVARNKALALAMGEWIGFIDADDAVEPSWLAVVKETIEREGVDLVRMRLKLWYPETNTFDVPRGLPACKADGMSAALRWGWNTFINSGWLVLVFIRADVLKRSRVLFPPGMKMKEDVTFALNLMVYLESAVQVDFIGYRYRMRKGSAWHREREFESCRRVYSESLALWDRSFETIRLAQFLPEAQALMSRYLWQDFLEWVKSADAHHCCPRELFGLMRESARRGALRWNKLSYRWWMSCWILCNVNGSFGLRIVRLTMALNVLGSRVKRLVLK